MRFKSSLSGSRDAKAALAAIAIVAILIVSTIGVFIFATGLGAAEKKVVSGSVIKVNYIGQLPDGRVFDTSLFTVASDNTTYPKSLFYTYRGSETMYGTLNFTVGAGSMITGFDRGVLGMAAGETKTITVEPSQGYGNMDPTKIFTYDINETIPILKTMTAQAFKTMYKQDASTHLTVVDPKYGWQVTVLSASDSAHVLVMNGPSDGSTYGIYSSADHPTYGWTATVTNIDSYNITVHHNLDASSVRNVGCLDENSVKTLVITVDPSAGKYTVYKDNNRTEQKSVVLSFTVTVVSIA